MYKLTLDGNIVSTHDTLYEAFKARNAKVREICLDLYDNDAIDKYSVEDWCFELDRNRDMSFSLDVGPGYYLEIVTDHRTPGGAGVVPGVNG